MITSKCYRMLLIVGFSGCATPFATQENSRACRLSSLGPEERIELRYSKQSGLTGGHSNYELEFICRDGRIVVEDSSPPVVRKDGKPHRRGLLQALVLSDRDVMKVDRMLEACQEEKRRLDRGDLTGFTFSTSPETVEVTKFRGSRRLATEKFSEDVVAGARHENVRIISELIIRMKASQ